MSDHEEKQTDINEGQGHELIPPTCSARFVRLQPVKFPLGDGTYQECEFIGVDAEGVATVKTKGGRYRTIWDCNLYPQNSPVLARSDEGE